MSRPVLSIVILLGLVAGSWAGGVVSVTTCARIGFYRTAAPRMAQR